MLTSPGFDDRESSDNYRAVVAILNERWRVIECRDRIQWILQKRDGERSGRPRWTGRSYCRTREGLLQVCRHNAGACDPTALDILGRLPDQFREPRQ